MRIKEVTQYGKPSANVRNLRGYDACGLKLRKIAVGVWLLDKGRDISVNDSSGNGKHDIIPVGKTKFCAWTLGP